MNTNEYALSPRDLYLFDTQGFLHLPQQLSPEEVEYFRQYFLGNEPQKRLPATHSDRWENILALAPRIRTLGEGPRVVQRMRNVINQPLRMLESYAIRSHQGSFLYMHNGNTQELVYADGTRATVNMSIRHEYHDGLLYCTFVKAIFYLQDVPGAEAGPFCYVHGSHKANYKFPWPKDGQDRAVLVAESGFPSLAAVPVRAGDMILLNEALLHGTLPKSTPEERIIMAFSFAPAYVTDWVPLERSPGDIHTPGHYYPDCEEDFFE
jgi:hypothetical protein